MTRFSENLFFLQHPKPLFHSEVTKGENVEAIAEVNSITLNSENSFFCVGCETTKIDSISQN